MRKWRKILTSPVVSDRQVEKANFLHLRILSLYRAVTRNKLIVEIWLTLPQDQSVLGKAGVM